MKKIKLFATIGLLAGCLAILSACGNAIDAPNADGFTVDKNNKLSWKPVSGARYYVVQITDVDTGEVREVNAKKTSYSLSTLQQGDYEIRIKAIAGANDTDDSKWSEICYFTKEYESGCVYRLVNNMEYHVIDQGAATGEVRIEAEYRGKPVTQIADSAFRYCTELTSIVIEEGITYIGKNAFYNCSNLESVTLPQSLTTIGQAAFQICRSLKTVTIPDSVTKIEEATFKYCRGLENVDLGKGVKEIGISAFDECSALTKLTLPDSVEVLGERAFGSNDLLTEVSFGKNIREIGTYAFSHCQLMTTVNIPQDAALTTIGYGAFHTCTALENITFPNGLETISENAFYMCTALDEPAIPASVTCIQPYAFHSTKFYTEAVEQEAPFIYVGNWVIDCTIKDKTTTDEIGIERGWKITAENTFDREIVGIADRTFDRATALEQVTLPVSVKYLGVGAFSYCPRLDTINLANTQIETIGERAFYNCALLGKVTLKKVNGDSALKRIESYAFYGCKALMNSALGGSLIPESVTSIGTYAFRKTGMWENPINGLVYAGDWVVGYNAENMTEASIRANTRGVADFAFYKCETLKSISGLHQVDIIGRGAFSKCISLERVVLPTDLKEIRSSTFNDCLSLFDISLPERLTSIGKYAFEGCEKLNAIDFTKTRLTTIEDRAFFGCTNLETVTFNKDLETIGECAFYKCTMLKEVNVPDSVTKLGVRAFANCETLSKITLGAGIDSIPDYAFQNAKGLEELVIPSNIKTIGAYAFYKCDNLVKVTLEEGVESIGKAAFYGAKNLQRLNLSDTVKEIGMYAFKGAEYLQAVVLGDNVEVVDAHAFYGCKQMTVYISADSIPEGWHPRWNTSYRPVIWGCELSEDGYVASVTIGEDTVYNKKADNVIVSPKRAGYTFGGWSATVDGVETVYTASEIATVLVGTVLTAIWNEGDEPLVEIPVEDEETDSSEASSEDSAA